MGPDFFHIDYEMLFEILITIVILSLFIERALSILFESRFFINKTETGKILLKMQITATEGILVAVSALTLIVNR